MPLPPVDDPAPFLQAAREGLSSVPGCWRLGGAVRAHTAVSLLGSEDAAWSFTAELVEGVWRNVVATELGDSNPGLQTSFGSDDGDIPFVPPLLGRVPDAGEEGGDTGILPAILGLLQRDTETAFVVPDEERYRLERTLESRRRLFGGTRENVVRVWFTPGGRPVSWHVVAEVPTHLSGVTLREVDATLSVDADGLPVDERLEAVGAWGPFTLTVDRTITYRPATRCPS